MEIKEKFAKVNMKDIVKFKIKWFLKAVWYCINKPLELLLKRL